MPLLQDLVVVPAQAVNAFDGKGIPLLQFSDQPRVPRTDEILAGLFVQEDVPFRNAELPHGDPLTVLILIPRRDTYVSILLC